MRLKDKSVVITGSNRGIGRIIAIDMAKEGTKLVINGTTTELVDEVVEEIKCIIKSCLELFQTFIQKPIVLSFFICNIICDVK